MPLAKDQIQPAAADPPAGPDPPWAHGPDDELSAMQTDSDRLLLMTMQASLSLVGFGFTIYQIFSEVAAKTGIARASVTGSRVGIGLLLLGFVLLAGGLWTNLTVSRRLDTRRKALAARGLPTSAPAVPISPVFFVAALLLLLTLAILGAIGVHILR